MSGDLKKPGKAIPLGTFTAIGFTMLIYAGIAVLMASSSSREKLMSNVMVIHKKAWFGPPHLCRGDCFDSFFRIRKHDGCSKDIAGFRKR